MRISLLCVFVKINTYVVFPFVLLWTIWLLLMPINKAHSKCLCESESEALCDIVSSTCFVSPLQVIPYRAAVVLGLQTVRSFAGSLSVHLAHGVVEMEEEKVENSYYSYIPSLFPVYMLLHLVVMFLETLTHRPLPCVTDFANQLRNIHSSTTKKNEERSEEIRTLIRRTPMSFRKLAGYQILAVLLIGFVLAILQVVLIAVHADDTGSKKLVDWLFGIGNMEDGQFMYNAFPESANCWLDKTICFEGNSNQSTGAPKNFPCFFENPDSEKEVISTCFFYTNTFNRACYATFYLWACIYSFMLVFRLVVCVSILTFWKLRRFIFIRWAKSYIHFVCNFSLICKHISAFEFLYLLRLSSVLDDYTFTEFLKNYSAEAQSFMVQHSQL